MNNYSKIYLLFLMSFILIFSGNVYASIDFNKEMNSITEQYKLCQSDTNSDDQSEIYQEPEQKEDENIPAEIDKQPDENNDSETN